MRELKFRAWNVKKKEMINLNDERIYDDLDAQGWYSLGDVLNDSEDWKVMQFTGLKDKNGKNYIYEGDIIDTDGNVRGNIHETPKIHEENPDWIIATLCPREWADFIKRAIERGCIYAE